MIDICTLNSASIGAWVEYNDGHGKVERGRIKSFNDEVIFVVYRCDERWTEFENFTAEATEPRDLTFINKCRTCDGSGFILTKDEVPYKIHCPDCYEVPVSAGNRGSGNADFVL